MTDRELLLNLVGSLTLDDHMGDVADDVLRVLKELGIEDKYDEVYDEWQRSVGRTLHDLGVTTLYGSPLYGPDEEDDE